MRYFKPYFWPITVGYMMKECLPKVGIKLLKIFHVRIYGMQKQPSCKKEAWPSKVESYLKDE